MSVKRFKTNARCSGCVARIGEYLNRIVASDQWSIDLASGDKILTVSADIPTETIVQTLHDAGFKAEPIK